MDREWIEKQKAESRDSLEKECEKLKQAIIDFGKFKSDKQTELFSEIDEIKTVEDYEEQWIDLNAIKRKLQCAWLDIEDSNYIDMEDEYDEYDIWFNTLDFKALEKYIQNWDRYVDSKPVSFDGDIIITDPCYIMRAEYHGTKPITQDDWRECRYGSNMEALGIKTYMTRDTIYGDWSCTTYDSDTGAVLGRFCADAGLVSVFDLSEVLKYNPEFNYHTEKSYTTTWIKDFKGTVQFIVEHEEGEYGDDSEYHNKGEKWEYYSVKVVGHGVNKVTGEPINFITEQTGF